MTQNFDRIYIGIFALLAVVALIKFFKEPNVANFSIFILTVFGSYLTVKDLNDTSKKLNYLKKLADINDTITKNIDSLNRVNNVLSGKIKAAVDASNELSNKIYSISSIISKSTGELNKFATGGDSYPYFYIEPSIGHFDRLVKTIGNYPLSGAVVRVIDLNSTIPFHNYEVYEDTLNEKLFDVPPLTVSHWLDRYFYPKNMMSLRTFAFKIKITTKRGDYEEYYAIRRRYKSWAFFARLISVNLKFNKDSISGHFLNKGETAQDFFDHMDQRDTSYLNRQVYPFPQLGANGVIP